MLFSVISEKSNSLAKVRRSIWKGFPAIAPLPKGKMFTRFRISCNLSISALAYHA